MNCTAFFEQALNCLDSGNVVKLKELLQDNPGLAQERDESNATLLIRLIDYPGHRPQSAKSAKLLIDAGVDMEARRDEKNGTALAGALCTNELDVVHVLVESGADVRAPLGWMPGINLGLADRMCQDLGKQGDEKIIALAKLFTEASGSKIPSQAPCGGTVPLIFVKDVSKGIDFYTKQLGFHVDWIHQEPDCEPYVGLSRGQTDIHLTDCGCEDKRHVGNTWLRIECDLVDDLFEQLDTAVVDVLQEPQNRPWGFREIQVQDPDGNRFTFFGPTTEE